MKLLNDIISEHFPPTQKTKVKSLLKKYNIFETLDDCTRYLKEELELKAKENSKLTLTIFSATTSNLLIGVNNQISLIANCKEKKKVKKVVAEIALRMLFSVFTRFPEEALDVFEIVKETVSSLAKQNSYDISELEGLLDFDGISQMIRSISGQEAADQITSIKATSSSRLVWTERVRIEVLSRELNERKWLKSEQKFWRLFDDCDKEVLVNWNISFKWHLAYLLHILKKEDFVRTTVTKGYYKLVQDKSLFNGNLLPNDTLKKLASIVRKDPKKYHDVVMSVEEIMKKLRVQS